MKGLLRIYGPHFPYEFLLESYKYNSTFPPAKLYGNMTVTYGSGTMRMINEEDRVTMDGDYENRSRYSYTDDITQASSNYNVLRAGSMEIKGNLTEACYYYFAPCGTHIVYMKGDKARNISLSNGSKFNILKLDKSPDYYTITGGPEAKQTKEISKMLWWRRSV